MANFIKNVRNQMTSVLGSPDPRYEGGRRRVQRDPRIWRNRIQSELDRLESAETGIPKGFSVLGKTVDVDQGVCEIRFRLATHTATGEQAACEAHVDAGAGVDFPFEAPGVRVVSGTSLFPASSVAEDGSLLLVDWVPARTLGDVLTHVKELVEEARDSPWHRQASQAITRKGQRAIASIRSRKDKSGRRYCEGQTLPAVETAHFGRLFLCRSVIGAGAASPGAGPQAFVGVTIEQLVMLRVPAAGEVDLIRAASGEDTATVFTVALARSLQDLSRLRLREKVVLTLQFREGAGDLTLEVQEAKILVTALKEAMTRRGVKNRQTALQKHETNRAHRRMGSTASQFLISIETAEQQLAHHPCIEAIQAVMDLFRQALEFFGSQTGDDQQILAVLEHKNRFLQRADVQLILNDHAPEQRRAKPATDKPDGHLVDSDDDEDSDGAERVTLRVASPAGGDSGDDDEAVRTIVGSYAEMEVSEKGQVLRASEGVYDSDDDGLEKEARHVGLGRESQALGPGLRELRDMIGKVETDDGAMSDMTAEAADKDGDDFLSFISTLQDTAGAGGGGAKSSAGGGSGSFVDDFDMDAVFAELDQITAPQGHARPTA